MLRKLSFVSLLFGGLLHAQPDSLYVPVLANGTGGPDTVMAYAVVYEPLQDVEHYRRAGHYAFDTARVAVELDYKRGKPCGIYRAFYPDGKQLIFAVYGWGWLHGDWTEYDPFGRITVKGQYREGKRDGAWTFRQQGIRGHYKEGEKNGVWKYYENDKLVKKEKWHKGQLRTGSTFLFGL
jgi:hypothetical protein